MYHGESVVTRNRFNFTMLIDQVQSASCTLVISAAISVDILSPYPVCIRRIYIEISDYVISGTVVSYAFSFLKFARQVWWFVVTA